MKDFSPLLVSFNLENPLRAHKMPFVAFTPIYMLVRIRLVPFHAHEKKASLVLAFFRYSFWPPAYGFLNFTVRACPDFTFDFAGMLWDTA